MSVCVVHMAGSFGADSMTRRLMTVTREGVNTPDAEGNYPIHHSVSRQLCCLRALLACGADFEKCDRRGLTALGLARELGRKSAMQLLLNLGARRYNNHKAVDDEWR
jgi:ankyrin repeat protein